MASITTPLFRIAAVWLMAVVWLTTVSGEDNGFVTLCYHDIVLTGSDATSAEGIPVNLEKLTDHFDWLRDNGWQVIDLDAVLAYRSGQRTLPEKSVLITFDDGYSSFYRFVFPLLKEYGYTAVLALETGWLETPDDQPVVYGDTPHFSRSYFLSWEQIKEMADSGWVELASHSHNLHQTHVSMPQGIQQPMAATLAYDQKTGRYESVTELYARVKDDVVHSADIIAERTGHRPRLLVWPYGQYNQMAVQAALDAGYLLTASLGRYADGVTIPRYLIYQEIDSLQNVMTPVMRGIEPGNSQFSRPCQSERGNLILPTYPLQRVIHMDLDTVYDPDPEQMDRNMSSFFDRDQAFQINVVYLQAFADPDGNGTADALYFPSRHLPMRADLFNYVAWQLQRRLGVQVYAWMPVLGFEIPGCPVVRPLTPDTAGSDYHRLTPFNPENRRLIGEIYEDLARQAIFNGIIFHDDALLGDYEDASPDGIAWLESIGLPADLAAVRADADQFQYFSEMKTRYVTEFSLSLQAAAERWSPKLRTARNMYASAVLNPEAETWLAQNLNDMLEAYDYVGLMAMPYMEGAAAPEKWLRKLAREVGKHPLGRQKTVFELQARDWREGHRGPLPTSTLAKHMRLLQLEGIGNLGYYPEDPVMNHPNVDELFPAFSLLTNQYERYRPAPPGGGTEREGDVSNPGGWILPEPDSSQASTP